MHEYFQSIDQLSIIVETNQFMVAYDHFMASHILKLEIQIARDAYIGLQ